MCIKCVDECPTGAIVKVNFPVRKPKPVEPKAEAAKPATVAAEAKQAATEPAAPKSNDKEEAKA